MAIITGSARSDKLSGTSLPDELFGLANDDTLQGLAGDDTAHGGDGDDQLQSSAGADLLDGGPGRDAAYYGNASGGIVIDLASGEFGGAAAGDRFMDIELIWGSIHDDRLLGDAGNNYLFGGEDSLSSRGGDDFLDGRGGNDTLQATRGEATMVGGDGDDVLTSGHLNRVHMRGGPGHDLYQDRAHPQLVRHSAALITELPGEGIDTVSTLRAQYTLGPELENLVLGAYGPIIGTGNDLDNEITGSAIGIHTLSGGLGADTLRGGVGADVLIGGPGDDWLWGGLGPDRFVFDSAGSALGIDRVLDVGNGDALVFASLVIDGVVLAGDDGSLLGAGQVMVGTPSGGFTRIHVGFDATPGADFMVDLVGTFLPDDVYVPENLGHVQLFPQRSTPAGSSSYDVLGGTPAADVLSGLADYDTLYGHAGNDTLLGGDGDDLLLPGAGSDVVDGASGRDVVAWSDAAAPVQIDLAAGTLGGAAAGDVVIGVEGYAGSAFADRLSGGSAGDKLLGGDGDDTLVGGPGADILDGEGGADLVEGGEGGDLLSGSGADTVLGGPGNDGLTGGGLLVGGLGDDYYVVYEADANISEAPDEGLDKVEAYLDYFALPAHVEHLNMRSGTDDRAVGNALDNQIFGWSGADTLLGADGRDLLDGGPGDDELDGGSSADTLRGGSGNDRYWLDAGDRLEESGSDPDDVVFARSDVTLADGIERGVLVGSATRMQGHSGANHLTGNGLVNHLTGLDGNDTLLGGPGDDSVIGGAGDDLLVAGTGADVLNGGAGADIYEVGLHDRIDGETAEGGVDTVRSSVNLTLPAYLEHLVLVGSRPALGNGNNLDNGLTGNDRANVLQGGRGNDTLRGEGGNDTLVGGRDQDTLIGGAGNDVFGFTSIRDSASAAPDLVTDLGVGDRLDFRSLDADPSLAGDQAFTHVIAFSGHAGQLVLAYSRDTGRTTVSLDADGDSVADLAVLLVGQFSNTALILL